MSHGGAHSYHRTHGCTMIRGNLARFKGEGISHLSKVFPQTPTLCVTVIMKTKNGFQLIDTFHISGVLSGVVIVG